MVKKIPTRNGAGNPDFTYNDLNRAGIRFNNKNVIEIEYYSDSEDLTITKTDELTETVKTIVTNFDNPGGGAVLGTKTITENGTYTAADDELDGYSSVTVNVPAAGGITVDEIASGAKPSGEITISNAIITRAFQGRSNITKVNLNGMFYMGNYAFSGCSGITEVNAPNITGFRSSNYNASEYLFDGCSSLATVNIPNYASSVPAYCFQNCSSLINLDLANASSISGTAFKGAGSLRTLILRRTDQPCSLASWNQNAAGGIYSHPDESTIYVPEDLLDDYEIASNWSAAYAAGVTFEKIEGSIYE